ncbi:MAG TPA: cytochrome P460 family protein [Xanthobacteraceae bacterium]
MPNHATRGRLHRAGVLAGLAAVACAILALQAKGQSATVPQYSPAGELLVPIGYETWVFVGSNLGLAYRQGLPVMTTREATRADQRRFHNVYINKEAYAYFLANRAFPEPTILAMEVFAAADKEPSGVVASGVYNGDRLGLEVAVKNSSRPDGRTTPWAYYDFTDPTDASKLQASAPANDDRICESCHRQHAGKDNVWVQFYPVLRN